MKLPAEPESRRVVTETTKLPTVDCGLVDRGFILVMGGRMVLTNARGGRRGHSRILWSLAPQYRHNPSVSCLRLPVDDRRLQSVCMGSGGSLISGWRMGGVAMATDDSTGTANGQLN